MAAGKRPALPLVLTASELLDGDIVFHTGSGWSRSLGQALVARDDGDAARLEAALAEVESGGPVVEPYLMTVALEADGRPVPGHYRERIRLGRGPTFERAQGHGARQEAHHVSL